MRTLLVALPLLSALPATVAAKVQSEVATYKEGETTLEGVIAWDDAKKGARPVVLVVHEWKGPGPYSQRRAEELAALGYLGFAVDMYGKGVRPTTHEEAGKVAGALRSDRNLMRARIRAALEFVRKDKRADPKRVAAIGYCFGGSSVLELARSGADVLGVASFHGALDTPAPAQKGQVKARVIAFHGGADPHVTADKVSAFEREMTEAGADWQLVVYGDAVHSFTVPDAGSDPSSGVAYNEKADRRSWRALQNFLGELFGA